MNKIFLLFTFLLLLIGLKSMAQQAPFILYQIYLKTGKTATVSDLDSALSQADVVLFGEAHDNPIAHTLQLKMLKVFTQQHNKVAVGLEMLEADQQLLCTEFATGAITQKQFTTQLRAWPNHATDYQPLLNYAQKAGCTIAATNVPRRYANVVFHSGFEALQHFSEQASQYIAPLPIEVDTSLQCYAKMLHMMPRNHKSINLIWAQAIKDATMAHFINKQTQNGLKVFHVNGSWHSDGYEGIVWYLKKLNPNTNILLVTTIYQAALNKLSDVDAKKADIIILTDPEITKTH